MKKTGGVRSWDRVRARGVGVRVRVRVRGVRVRDRYRAGGECVILFEKHRLPSPPQKKWRNS